MIDTIKVKLTGHDYRYEVYQILSLFYAKDDISFVDEFWDIEIKYIEQEAIACCSFSADGCNIKESIPVEDTTKKNIKNALKLTALRVLEEYTGEKMPWGILVGIRPTKLVHEFVQEGLSLRQAKEHLMKYYNVSEEKACLAVQVSESEAPLLKVKPGNVSLYVHIPFCPTRCIYCSFTSNPIARNERLINDYISCLKKEAASALQMAIAKGVKFDTFYIGGGTPTALSPFQLDELLGCISTYVDFGALREFTVEAGRPDSITRDKLRVLKNYGCTRISINPQTMNDATLERIGRTHNSADVIEKYAMAREEGIDTVNMDMIVGLPGEGCKEMLHTVSEVAKLKPDNITVHTMAIKRASILNEKKYISHSLELQKAYDEVSGYIRDTGMYPYYMYRQKNMVLPLENIGYSVPKKECIYNVQMIAENISILSLGADAVTKLVYPSENRIERTANIKDVREYINRIDEALDKKRNAIELMGI